MRKDLIVSFCLFFVEFSYDLMGNFRLIFSIFSFLYVAQIVSLRYSSSVYSVVYNIDYYFSFAINISLRKSITGWVDVNYPSTTWYWNNKNSLCCAHATDHAPASDVYKLLNLVWSKWHIKLLSLIMYVGCLATSIRSPPRGLTSEPRPEMKLYYSDVWRKCNTY